MQLASGSGTPAPPSQLRQQLHRKLQVMELHSSHPQQSRPARVHPLMAQQLLSKHGSRKHPLMCQQLLSKHGSRKPQRP